MLARTTKKSRLDRESNVQHTAEHCFQHITMIELSRHFYGPLLLTIQGLVSALKPLKTRAKIGTHLAI